jgi:hypothetical protein
MYFFGKILYIDNDLLIVLGNKVCKQASNKKGNIKNISRYINVHCNKI